MRTGGRTVIAAGAAFLAVCAAAATNQSQAQAAGAHHSDASAETVAHAPAPAAKTTRVSLSMYGGQGNGSAYGSALSRDGRVVAFVSGSSDLVPGDTNGRDDVFVRDLTTDTLTRVNVSSTGAQGNGVNALPPSVSLSGDGRYVAFQTDDSNLVPGGTSVCRVEFPSDQPCPSIFLRDMKTGSIRLVSVSTSGANANGLSEDPVISADGRYIAFLSMASNLVPGDTNDSADVFVRDVRTGTTRRVSIPANKGSASVSISADGRYVAFLALQSASATGSVGVYVRDLETGTTRRVGVWGTQDQLHTGNVGTSISGDGRYVAFVSYASHLVPGDTNNTTDVFVRDLKTGKLRRVSVTKTGAQSNQYASQPVMSANGRYVLFSSLPMALPAGSAGPSQIFLRDLVAGTTREVSVSSTGVQSDGDCFEPAISGDGKYLAFATSGANLVTGDTNQQSDVFLRGPLH